MSNTLSSSQEVQHYIVIFIAYHDLWMLISALFTSAGGILSLYGVDGEGGSCRREIGIVSIILQGIALVFCSIALATGAWKIYPQIKFRGNHLNTNKKRTEQNAIIQSGILIVVNIVCLIMVVLILVTEGCNHFGYTAVYNIVGTAGSFLITLILSFELQRIQHDNQQLATKITRAARVNYNVPVTNGMLTSYLRKQRFNGDRLHIPSRRIN